MDESADGDVLDGFDFDFLSVNNQAIAYNQAFIVGAVAHDQDLHALISVWAVMNANVSGSRPGFLASVRNDADGSVHCYC